MPMKKLDAKRIWSLLETVSDPEIPALSVVDMGIVREIEWEGDELQVSITPTYSGCPAVTMIENEIVKMFRSEGVAASVRRVLSPPWTTEWLSEKGRRMLLESGIAPPAGSVEIQLPGARVACPFCASEDTEVISEFGSTACKSLHRCRACGSPFDYFKPL
jgi:ring-1,2-phenylacetyl-CoA epoxidase subunit PaaD